MREIPKPPPGYVPGEKRARHMRNAKIATWITVASLALALGFGVFLLIRGLGPSEDSRVRDTKSTLQRLAADVERFRTERSRLPRELGELFSVERKTEFDAQPLDKWHQAIDYKTSNDGFRLRSHGPDKTPDTPDDLVWPVGATWN